MTDIVAEVKKGVSSKIIGTVLAGATAMVGTIYTWGADFIAGPSNVRELQAQIVTLTEEIEELKAKSYTIETEITRVKDAVTGVEKDLITVQTTGGRGAQPAPVQEDKPGALFGTAADGQVGEIIVDGQETGLTIKQKPDDVNPGSLFE